MSSSSESSRFRTLGDIFFDIGDKVGPGGGSAIFKGKFKIIDVAVKRTKNSCNGDVLLKVSLHPNIVRFYSTAKDAEFT